MNDDKTSTSCFANRLYRMHLSTIIDHSRLTKIEVFPLHPLRSNFPPFPRAARKKVSRFINGNNFAAWKGAFPRTVRIRCVDLFFPSFCARRNTLYPIRSGNCNIRRKQLHTARSRLEQSIGFRINGRCPGDKGGSIRAFGFSFQRGLRNVNRTSKILD